MNPIKCVICGSDSREILYKINDINFYVVKCRICNLFYTFPQPDTKSFYPDNYYSYSHYPAKKFLSVEQLGFLSKVKISIKKQILNECYGYFKNGNRRILFSIPKFILNYMKYYFVIFPPFIKEGKLLDVGCGSGEYLFVIQQLGWDVYGIELSEKAASYARDKGLKVITGAIIENGHYPSEYFDIVRFNHALEHFPDPVSTLKESHRILKNNGLLLITAPNVNSIERDIWGKYCWQLQMPEHLFHFSENSLKKLLDKTGFRVKKIEYLPYAEVRGNVYNFIENIFGPKSYLINFLNFKSIKLLNRILQVPLGYLFSLFKKSNTISVYANKSSTSD